MQTVLQQRAQAWVSPLALYTNLTMLQHRMELDGEEAFILLRLKNFVLALLNLLTPGCSFELTD